VATQVAPPVASPYREPRDTAYASVERFAPGDTISPLVDLPPVDVAALLGR
jgi:hypothetical protein